MVHLQRPDQICGSFPSALKLAGLVEIAHYRHEGELFFAQANRSLISDNRFGINSDFFDGLSRFFAREASDFTVQSRDHSRKPDDPFGKSLALRKPRFNSILVSEQALSKGAVESFHNHLFSVNLCAPMLDVCFVFFHFFCDSVHESW